MKRTKQVTGAVDQENPAAEAVGRRGGTRTRGRKTRKETPQERLRKTRPNKKTRKKRKSWNAWKKSYGSMSTFVRMSSPSGRRDAPRTPASSRRKKRRNPRKNRKETRLRKTRPNKKTRKKRKSWNAWKKSYGSMSTFVRMSFPERPSEELMLLERPHPAADERLNPRKNRKETPQERLRKTRPNKKTRKKRKSWNAWKKSYGSMSTFVKMSFPERPS